MTTEIREERKIETFIEREDTGTNRNIRFSVKINRSEIGLPSMTISELRQVKEALDIFLKDQEVEKRRIVTVKEMREGKYEGLYKIHQLNEKDAYYRALCRNKITMEVDSLILYHSKLSNEDRITKGSMKYLKDLSSPVSIYLHEETLVELLNK